MKKSLWIIAKPDTSLASSLSSKLNISPLIAQILINRKIDDPLKAEVFLKPRLLHLRDPLELPDATKASQRVLKAKEKKDLPAGRQERIVVYGDYDVDGVTGTAILVRVLQFMGCEVSYYIPHRFGEGYSLSIEAINTLAQQGTGLIITVDCGISSVKEVAAAKKLGIDVIITDHHNPPLKLPDAYALVNPKLIKTQHPTKNLSGAGVAFKFAWALLKIAGIKDAVFLASMLDLAGLGTLADVVPLNEENRIIAINGLKALNESKRPGIQALLKTAGLKDQITENQVYFGIAPRINAAGRLEHASKAVELLLCQDQIKAQAMAQELQKINVRRQDIGQTMQEEAFAKVTDEYIAENKVILLCGQDWHPGVIGIVASRLVDRYNRPTVLLGINDGMARGSARSVKGINIYEILNHCRELFADFGGHEGAAGFAIDPKKIPELELLLKIAAEKYIHLDDLEPKINIDAQINASDLTLSSIKELDVLAPFGEGNRAPIFMISKIKITDMKTVGKNSKHLKLKCVADGVYFDCIGFSFGEIADKLLFETEYDLAFTLGTNQWNGFESAQLSLVDIKLSA